MLERKARDQEGAQLGDQLSDPTESERRAVDALVGRSVIDTLHGLLHGLSHDEDRIRLSFDGHDVAEQSDGMQGDLFTFVRVFAGR